MISNHSPLRRLVTPILFAFFYFSNIVHNVKKWNLWFRSVHCRNRILKRVLLLALLPATVLAVISLWTSTAPDVDHVTSRFIRYHVDAYEQYESKQSWLFAFVTALVYPISLHFTTVAWSTAAWGIEV